MASEHHYATISLTVGSQTLTLSDRQWEQFTCLLTAKEKKKKIVYISELFVCICFNDQFSWWWVSDLKIT